MTPQRRAEGLRTVREEVQNGPRSEKVQARGRSSLGYQETASRSAEIFGTHDSVSFLIGEASTPKRREANVNFRRGSDGQVPAGSRLLSSIARRSDGFFDGRNIQKILNLQETRLRKNDSIDKESQENAAKMKILADGVPLSSSPDNPGETEAIVENQAQNTSDYNSADNSQTSQQSQERSASGNALQPKNSNSASRIPVRTKTPLKSQNPLILVSRVSPNENKENDQDWSKTPVSVKKAYFEANKN